MEEIAKAMMSKKTPVHSLSELRKLDMQPSSHPVAATATKEKALRRGLWIRRNVNQSFYGRGFNI